MKSIKLEVLALISLLFITTECAKKRLVEDQNSSSASSTVNSAFISPNLILYPNAPPIFKTVANELMGTGWYSGSGDGGSGFGFGAQLSADATSFAYKPHFDITNDTPEAFSDAGNFYKVDLKTKIPKLGTASATGQSKGNYAPGFTSFAKSGNFLLFYGDMYSIAGLPALTFTPIIRRDLVKNTNALVTATSFTGSYSLNYTENSISADGKYVTYGGGGLIYRKDMDSGTLSEVTLASDGVTEAPAEPFYSGIFSISPNGNRVSYIVSDASKIVNAPGISKQLAIIDLQKNSKMIASVTKDGVYTTGEFGKSLMSSDGNIVVFMAEASVLTNLAGAIPGQMQIFTKNLTTKNLDLVTTNTSKVGLNATSKLESISDDGRFVCFSSSATNTLTDTGWNSGTRIFVKDTLTGALALISRVSLSSGLGTSVNDSGCSLSSDGQFALFSSTDGTLAGGKTTADMIYLYFRQITTP